MFGIAAMLSKYAHDSSTDLKQRAVFSSITTILNGALAAQAINDLVQNALVARDEIAQLSQQTASNAQNRQRIFS